MRMLLLLCLTEDTRLLHSIYRILSIKYLVCRKNRRTAFDGKKYLTQFYNLDAIIAVGYRYTVPIVGNEIPFEDYVYDCKCKLNSISPFP